MTDLALRDVPAPEQTVRLAAAGDQAAFARLVATHHPSMARVAYAITGDADSAADAVQIAWTAAWRRLPTLRDPGTVAAWLVAIAANEARQVLRRRRARPLAEISPEVEATLTAPGGLDGADPAGRIETVDLARALRRLDPDERALLALRFVAGLDSGEIATHLGLSASGVRSRLARLLERLRKELDHA